MIQDFRKPARTDDARLAVDSYSKFARGKENMGQRPVALIGRKADLLDPQNTGKSNWDAIWQAFRKKEYVA